MLKLYGASRSRAFRCLWLLEEDAVARHGARLAEGWQRGPLGVLDASLADREFLLGARFTVADLNAAGMFLRPVLAAVDRAPWPRLARWVEAALARPALARVSALP